MLENLCKYTSLTYTFGVFTFVETPLFSRLVSEYLTDEEYSALQAQLAQNPEAGAVIRGSGGVRKLRWSMSGRGKRGGLRVIYYWASAKGEICTVSKISPRQHSSPRAEKDTTGD